MCFSLRLGENWITSLFSYSLSSLFDLCSSISAYLFDKPMCGKLSNGGVMALSWKIPALKPWAPVCGFISTGKMALWFPV